MLDVGCFRGSAVPDLRAWKRNHTHAIEPAQRHVTDGSSDPACEIKFARLTEGHGLAGVEEYAHGQFALLLVELEEQAIKAAIEIPVEVPEIVAGNVRAMVGKFDRLPARAAAALALGRTLGTPRCKQLELLKATQKFRSEEVVCHAIRVCALLIQN